MASEKQYEQSDHNQLFRWFAGLTDQGGHVTGEPLHKFEQDRSKVYIDE